MTAGITDRPANTRRPRLATSISRLILLGGLLGLAVLLAAYFRFAEAVMDMAPPAEVAAADAVVVFTGSSTKRLQTGLMLLEQGKAQRLLISGVAPEATLEEVRLAVGGTRQTFECCVDLGRQARDTIGNARELQQWVGVSGVTSVILVTENFHMQRSLLEVTEVLPDLAVIPYPVVEPPYDQPRWWDNPRAWRGLAQEFSKYLAVQLRQVANINLDPGG